MSLSSGTDSLFPQSLPKVPDYSIESGFVETGRFVIAGTDEAGRGPLAGPVVAAAVILDRNNLPVGLNDSKKLTAEMRETLFSGIVKSSRVSWASLPAQEIDRINIREASLRAMELSIQRLEIHPDHVLVDGRDVPRHMASFANAYIKGDGRSLSIAAASVVAKVVRDRMMIQAHQIHPEYGFDRHKGYGTKLHRSALASHGPCLLHRRSFAPVAQLLKNQRSRQTDSEPS